jgi:tetratricopeptide (TPR) repeat protein
MDWIAVAFVGMVITIGWVVWKYQDRQNINFIEVLKPDNIRQNLANFTQRDRILYDASNVLMFIALALLVLNIQPSSLAWAFMGVGFLLLFTRQSRIVTSPIAYWWNEIAYNLSRYAKPERIIRWTSNAIDHDHTFYWAYWNRGIAHQKLFQHDKALADFERALKLEPRDTRVKWLKSVSYLETKQYGQALELSKQLMDDGYAKPGVYEVAALTYGLNGDPETALKFCEQGIERYPTDYHLLAQRGSLLAQLNRRDEALAAFEDALLCDPKHVSTYQKRAYSLANWGAFEQAHKDVETVQTLKPNSDSTYGLRGYIYYLMHEYNKALNAFETSLDLDPNYTFGLAGKAVSCLATGEMDEAKMLIRELRRVEPAYIDIEVFILRHYPAQPFADSLRQVAAALAVATG